MTSDIYFDNFIITSHKEVADRWASDSWGLKKLVASANEVSVMFRKGSGNMGQHLNRHLHCHYVHVIYHSAVHFFDGRAHKCSPFCSCSLVSCFSSSARDFCSADDGSRGATVALGDLHPDSWLACRTDCALLLAKGTVHLMSSFIVCF